MPRWRKEVKNLPADATAHFIYFPTGGCKLDAKDEDQIRDVAGMIQSHPDFVATNPLTPRQIQLALRDSTSAYHNGAPMPCFEALVYDHKVAENSIQMCWTGERLPFTSTAD